MLKKILFYSLIFSLMVNHIVLAAHSVIALDFKDSQTAERLHIMPRLSDMSDVSHLEIDLKKKQVEVYRVIKAYNALPPLDEAARTLPLFSSVILAKHDIHNLPWELKPEKLLLYILNHTVLLTPLDPDRYKLELRNRLLGGMGKGIQDNSILDFSKPSLAWTKSEICEKHHLQPPVYPQAEAFAFFSGTDDPIQTMVTRANYMNKISIYNSDLIMYEAKIDKFLKEENNKLQQKIETCLCQSDLFCYSEFTQIAFLQQLLNTASWTEVLKYAEAMGIDREDVLKIDKNAVLTFESVMSQFNPFYSYFEKIKHIQTLIKTASKTEIDDYASKQGVSIEDISYINERGSGDLTFEEFMRERICFYADYQETRKVLQRVFKRKSWGELHHYAESEGISKEEMEVFSQLKPLSFTRYLRQTNPFFVEYEKIKHIQHLICTTSWPNVWAYLDREGFDRSKIDKFGRNQNLTFISFLRQTNPFFVDYEKVKHIHHMVRKALAHKCKWEDLYEYNKLVGFSKEEGDFLARPPSERVITFNFYMNQIFTPQIFEKWDIKNWRELFQLKEMDNTKFEVTNRRNLIKAILPYIIQKEKEILLKQRWQRILEVYEYQSV